MALLRRRFAFALGISLAAVVSSCSSAWDWSTLDCAAFNCSSENDFLTFEWEYFGFCSSGVQGIVSFVLANPRNRTSNLSSAMELPAGVSVAAVLWEPVAGATPKPRTYFGPVAGNTITKPDGGGVVLKADNSAGKIDLTVAPVTRARQFAPVTSDALPGLTSGNGTWTLDMLAPATRAYGTIETASGRTLPIDGVAYRGNAYGSNTIVPLGGWDFLFYLGHCEGPYDEETPELVWQSYSIRGPLGAIEMDPTISFVHVHAGNTTARFGVEAGELGWEHGVWAWDEMALACVPLTTKLRGTTIAADGARLELALDTKVAAQAPLLSDLSPATDLFFIMEQFLTTTGTLTRDGVAVASFDGHAGGEFANMRQTSAAKSKCPTPERRSSYSYPFPTMR